MTLCNTADLLRMNGDLGNAEIQYSKALEVYRKRFGEEDDGHTQYVVEQL